MKIAKRTIDLNCVFAKQANEISLVWILFLMTSEREVCGFIGKSHMCFHHMIT